MAEKIREGENSGYTQIDVGNYFAELRAEFLK